MTSRRFLSSASFGAALWFACSGTLVSGAERLEGPSLTGPTHAVESSPSILIRPANFDPDSPWEYTWRRGELAPGMSAGGKLWNRSSATAAPASFDEAHQGTQGRSRSIAAAADDVAAEAQAEDRSAPTAAASGTAPAPTKPPAPPAPGASAVPYTGPYAGQFTGQFAGPGPLNISYLQAYNSIPFSRAEYEANPGYRHEAALELMFGVLRPMTIMKQTIPYFSRYPDVYRYRFPVFPYQHSTPDTPRGNYFWNNMWGY